MKGFVALLILLISANALSFEEEKKKLYKWTDDNGVVHYSDLPQKGAQEIEMKLAPATKIEKSPVINIPKPLKNKTTDAIYESATLIEPLENGVVRNNTSTVTLTASLQPELQEGHSVRFFVDGGLIKSESGAMSVEAQDIALGQHTANFVVVNARGRPVISSATVHFQRLTRVNPAIKKKQKASRARTSN
jgi:hypothetical protein